MRLRWPATVQQAVSTFGHLDAAFNNAGIHVVRSDIADVEGSDFGRVIAVNRQMRRQNSGAIVNCSSQSGFVGIRGLGAFTASKHGVLGLTKAAALEYASQGIRIKSAPAPLKRRWSRA